MTDSGGGGKSVSFNYSSSKRTAYRAPVSTAKANQDTQTRYEQQQLAAQQAAQKAAQDRANVAAAMAKFQQEEAARLARESAAAAAAAAEAERKRRKLERDNWEASMSTYDMSFKDNRPTGNKVLANSIPSTKPPEPSFWDKVSNSINKGVQTFAKAQSFEPTSPLFWSNFAKSNVNNAGQFKDAKGPFFDNFNTKLPDDYKVPGAVEKGAPARFWNELKDSWKELEQTTPYSNPITKKPNPKYIGDRDENFNPYAGGLNSQDPWEVKPKQNLGEWFNSTMESLEDKFDKATFNREFNVGGTQGIKVKNKYWQDPSLIVGSPEFYAMQNAEAMPNSAYGMPKNPYKYWNEAKGDQLDFSKYPDPEAAAVQAQKYYEMYHNNYLRKQADAQKDIDLLTNINHPSMTGGSMVPSIEKLPLYNDITIRKAVNAPTFDPTTATGQRLIQEQMGIPVPSYAKTWLDMKADIAAGNSAKDKIVAQEAKLQNLVKNAPSEITADLSKYRVNTVEDYYKYIWNQDDPNTSLGPNTRMIGGTDPNTGEYIILPIEYFLGDRSMWDQGLLDKAFGGGHTVMNGNMYGGEDTPLSNPRRPLAKDANDPFLDYYVNPKIDRGWAINSAAPQEEAAPVEYPGGGIDYGGGGGGGGGQSFWSPSGYYDNQYSKDRYGYFQNLVKWVI